MNDTHVTITGWTGSDVTVTRTTGGNQVATFRVATNARLFRNGEWVEQPTVWHSVTCWRALAVHVAASVRRGDPVIVHGRLVADRWKRDDGSLATRHVLVASSVGHDLGLGTARFVRARPSEVKAGQGGQAGRASQGGQAGRSSQGGQGESVGEEQPAA